MAKGPFIVTVQSLEAGKNGVHHPPASTSMEIDPQDIYQSGLDATLRVLAWESLGQDAEDRLK